MSRILYAWRGEKAYELLDKHLYDCYNLFRINFARTMQLLYYKTNFKSVDERLFKQLTESAVLLHDIGKAHPQYQERSKFIHHEVLSAYTVYKLVLTCSNDEKLASMISLAILTHHQALGRGNQLEIACKELYKIGIKDWKIEYFESLLKSLVSRTGMLYLGECTWEDVRIREIINELKICYVKHRESVKLYALITGPLIMCDNMVACYNRRVNPPCKRENVEHCTFPWMREMRRIQGRKICLEVLSNKKGK